MATELEVQMANEAFLESLSTPGQEKRAVDAANSYTRTRLREDGVFRKIIPFVTISFDDLDVQVETDKPVKIVEKEPESPAAASVPFGQFPQSFYIDGIKYAIGFSRVLSRKMTKDVVELGMWKQDIRQILADNQVRDVAAEEDSRWFASNNAVLLGPGVPLPWSGRAQWETIRGGITRETLVDATKVMPRTDAHLDSTLVVVNNVTIKEVQKFGRDEMGGDSSQDILNSGFTKAEWMRHKWIGSIKRALIPDDSAYFYADSAFIGKAFELEAPTMYVKKDAFMLESFIYETIGAGIGNTAGLTRVDFA